MESTRVPGVSTRVGIALSPRGILVALLVLALGSPAFLLFSLSEPSPSHQFWMLFSLAFIAFAAWYAAFSSAIVLSASGEGLGFAAPLAFQKNPVSVIPWDDPEGFDLHGRRLKYGSGTRLRFLILWTNPQDVESASRRHAAWPTCSSGTPGRRRLSGRALQTWERASLLILPALALALALGAILVMGLADSAALAAVFLGLLVGLAATVAVWYVRARVRSG